MQTRARPLHCVGFMSNMIAMGRIARGWALTKQSWAVLKADRSLLVFPLISALASLLAVALIMGPGFAVFGEGDSEVTLYILGVLALYVATFVTVFFNTALAAAAAQSLGGKDTTLGDGLSVARSRIGAIFAWSLVQATVGIVIQVIQDALRGNIIGRILGSLLSFAWGAATFFVVPVLALEGLGPRDAFKRSISLLRERWGEGVVGSGAIGLAVFLAFLLPLAATIGGGIALLNSGSDAPGGVLLGVGVLLFIAMMAISGALNSIFRVALYQYATTGATSGGFSPDQLQSAFRPRRGRR